MITEENRYIEHQKEVEKWYESLCRKCGRCCGAGGDDPCGRLKENSDGTWVCTVYPYRLGQQKTVNGNTFNCVLIKEVLKDKDSLRGCAYRDNSI